MVTQIVTQILVVVIAGLEVIVVKVLKSLAGFCVEGSLKDDLDYLILPNCTICRASSDYY